MKLKGLFTLLAFGFALLLTSCTKLNEPTELGDELLPAVDNVNTFDTTLEISSNNRIFNDTTKSTLSDNMALGKLNDPVFGTTSADMYFTLSSPTYGASPFFNRDSVAGIDSVVLSLSYSGAYGDTSVASQIDVAVSEIEPGNGFLDTVRYRYDQPDFTTGPVLGTKSFSIPKFTDTITLIRKTDTTKVVNVLRIPLNTSLASKLKQFDTTGNGPYTNDSLFRLAFRGLAVKAVSAAGQGTLAYFSLSGANSGLTVYYRVQRNGVIDTTSTTFTHTTYGQANSIVRNTGGEVLANLNKPSTQKLYIQSSPTGTYAGLTIPGLSSFPNKIIHRAELIVYRVPSASESIFSAPDRLLLDHKGASDSAYLFDNDLQPDASGSLNLTQFGGTLRSDNSYRFNITRYVQGIVTRKDRNDSLRLYAPLRSILYSKSLGQYISVPNLTNIASGRVVLAGENFPDSAMRLRLRIIYSNL